MRESTGVATRWIPRQTEYSPWWPGYVEELNRRVAANPQNTDKAKHVP